MTNGDGIRKWSNEEIAEFTVGIIDETMGAINREKMSMKEREILMEQFLNWLKEEVKE